ncbi:MAG: sensor histidine kinase [Oscillospiraceae bacterium]
MEKLKQLFRTSIARTMLGGFLLVIIPTLILGLVSNAVGINVASNEISNTYAKSITLLSQQMADRLYNMDMLAALILLDDSLVALSNSDRDGGDLYDYVLFQKRMLLYRAPQFVDANIVVCLPKQGWIITTNTGIMAMGDLREPIYSSATQRSGGIWSIQKSLVSPTVDGLSVFRGYVHEKQSSPFIVMEISRAEMEKVLGTMSNNTQVLHTFFLDPFGEYFSSGDELEEELAQQVRTALAADSAGNEQHTIDYKGKTYRLLYQTVGSYNSKVGMLFDESEILRPVMNIRVFFIIFMIFAVSASLVFIFITYRRIFTPVRSLMDGMQELEAGNLNVRVEVEQNNEFSVMSHQFNDMVAQLDSLIMESYVKELKLKNAQLRFLRSQINPHFLYNSLFSLYSMIQNGELESASDMAVYLGKYYQRSTHLNERELAISEELENIRMYVQIMSIRFPERLRLVTDIEERTADLKIPVLSLQTVVENAVLHGMEGSARECVITVETRLSESALHLCVTDTGNGIPAEQLEQIRERLSRSVELEDRHGLENVYMRLKLMYGDGVSMTVTDNQPTGTRVEIRIPLKGGAADV